MHTQLKNMKRKLWGYQKNWILVIKYLQDIHSEEKSNELANIPSQDKPNKLWFGKGLLEKFMALNYVILQSHTHSSINTEMIKICTFCN